MKQKFKRLLSAILAIVLVITGLQFSGWTTQEAKAAVDEGSVIYFDTNGNSDFTTAGAVPSVCFKTSATENYGGNDSHWVKMDLVDGSTTLYKATVNRANITHVVFRRTSSSGDNWNSATTVLEVQGNCFTLNSWNNGSTNNAGGSWSTYTPGGSTPTPGTSKTIYFDTTAYLPSGWGAAYIYLYNSNTGAISGPVAMAKVSNGFYSYSVDTSIYTEVIFKPNAGSNWSGQTSGQTIPANKNLFTCTYFNTYTSGTWGVYSTTTTGGEFPSNVTGKATFFDLYTDYDINNSVYGSDYSNQTKTGILRAFDKNVNAAISNYWKNALTDEQEAKMYPLYFNAFQPYFYAKGGTDNWWKSANDTGTYAAYEAGFAESLLNFSWFVNRVLSANPDDSNASLSDGQDGAVVQGLVNDTLNSDGNITAKGTDVVLPQFNSAFYSSNSSIGKQYETVEFPFAARVINSDGQNVKYYQFDSGANGSTYRDVVRMNEDGTLSYYDGSVNPDQVVNGIPGDSKSVDNHTPGFFPFNVPSDSSSATTYDSANNKLNYGFGMKLEIEFTMDSDGKVYTVDKNSKVPATFEFSGDDDVWVYVDGKLALDMGGAHGIATGTIDFSSLENGNDKIKATVAYVKGIHSNGTVITDLDTIYETEQGYNADGKGDKSYINAYKDANAGLLTNVTKEIEFDATDATKIHKLTIFYEERGMYESNFKATFNLEQPTKVKVTNEVNVDNVNPAFQSATKAVAANDTFVYNFANGAKKTYVTQDDKTATVATDGKMTINDGQSATFVKQFDRDAELALSQSANSKYTTSWSFSDMDESGTINKPISASYESGRDSLTVSDGRVEGSETNKFLLENKNTEDDSVPARVLAAYVQNPKTGNIAIEKKLEGGFKSDGLFAFKVEFTEIFGSTAEAVLEAEKLTYNVYEEVKDADGKGTGVWVTKSTRVIGTDGFIKIQAGQRAVIPNVPIDTKYQIEEVSGTGYEVTDLTAAANNDTSVSTAGYKATGKVVSDADVTVYDLFTFTNDEVILKDAFLVELGKENTLSVIPNSSVDGTLTDDLKTIVDAYNEAKKANKTIGFVFIENGKPVVDENKKPVTEYTTGGVTYTVTYEDGEPVLTITPTGEQTSDADSVKVKYQLVELDGNGSVSYTTDTEDETVTTVDVVTPIITATNYLYQANDDIYVLDYGLDVNLADTSDNCGLFQNDTLANPSLTGTTSTYWNTTKGASTAVATASTTMAQYTAEVTGDYGKIKPAAGTSEFAISTSENVNPTVTYSMDKFLSNKDYFNYNVMLKKSASVANNQTSNRFRLNLTSNVTIMPASVVYYEDNFNADASSTKCSVKIIYSTDAPTTGVTLVQSNDQSEQYGYDEAYASGTEFSAGSATEMKSGAKAYFEFTGTGFDIISRTNRSTGNIVVYVYDATKSTLSYDKTTGAPFIADATKGLLSVMAVNTYYENGDLYQVPVIHKDMDTHGTYIVKIESIAPSDERPTVYIDGIRIYNPLGTDGDVEYLDNERSAEILNIREALFGKGFVFNYENPLESTIPTKKHNEDGECINLDQLPVATLFIESEDGDYYLSGKTVVEAYKASRYDSDIDLTDVTNDMMTYAVQGPNNELYLDGSGYAVGFDTTAEDGAEDSECTIQVGLKVVSGTSVQIQRQVSYDKWKDWVTVKSATEKYYVLDDDGNKDAFSFAIRVKPGTTGVISVTNLKVKNYTLSALDITTKESENETEDLNPYGFVYKSGCKTGFTKNTNATFTCKTPVGVEDIKLFSVNNSTEKVAVISKSYKVVGSGNDAYQLWTVRFKPTTTQKTYFMRAYDNAGNYSKSTEFGKGVTG